MNVFVSLYYFQFSFTFLLPSFCPVLPRCLCTRHSRTEHLVISTQIPPPEQLWVKVSASRNCLPTHKPNYVSWEPHLITSDTVISSLFYREAQHILTVCIPHIFIGTTKVSYFGIWRGNKASASMTSGFQLFRKPNYFQDKVKDMQRSLCRLRTLLNKKKVWEVR